MKTPVYILATCRNAALLGMTTLVFRTLRTGFPHASITVFGNGLVREHAALVQEEAAKCDAAFNWIRPTAHDVWLEHLVQAQGQPFWICDTDMVFFQPVEQPAPGVYLSGRYEPAFAEEWTQSWHAERLHTCLLYLDPQALRARMRAWLSAHVPNIFGHAETHFIRQHFVPVQGGPPTFMDTAAGLYHALGGTAFDEARNEAFEHLHCGSYSDLIGRCASLGDLAAMHAAVLADVQNARGLREAQDKYYASRRSFGRSGANPPEAIAAQQ